MLADRLRRSFATLRPLGVLLAVVVGLVAGFGAVGFHWLVRGFQWVFFDRGAVALSFLGDYYVIFLPAVGGLVVGLLIYFVAREAKGHGVPEVMEAVALMGGRIRHRVAVVKAVVASLCIGSGGSAGLVEPVVLMGASAGSSTGRWFRPSEEWIKTLVLCGAAGGIAASFNAPIGGVFFALEVIQRRFIVRRPGYIIISSVVAGFISHRFLGPSPFFSIPPYSMSSYWEIVPYAVLGIITAFVAIGFVRLFYRCGGLFDALKIPEYFKPALGGIIVGLIGWYCFDIFGVGCGDGYGVGGSLIASGGIDKALAGGLGVTTLLIMMVLKMVATSATLGSGGSGGIFAPSLFIGSMLGGAFGIGMYTLFPAITASSAAVTSGSYALVGMGAFFAGVAAAPITSIIMLFEMTRDYALILPLMTAVVFSTLVSRGLSRDSIYTLKLVRRGVDIHLEEQADVLKGIRVGEVMTRDFPTVPMGMSLPQLVDELHREEHHGFPVVDGNGSLYGVVSWRDVESAMNRSESDLTVGDIATKSPVVAYPDQTIYDALAQFRGRDVGRIPVVDRNDPKKLLGVLRRHDITRAYTRAISSEAGSY